MSQFVFDQSDEDRIRRGILTPNATGKIKVIQMLPVTPDQLYQEVDQVKVFCLPDGRILLERNQLGNKAKDVFAGLVDGKCKVTFRWPQDNMFERATVSNTNMSTELYEGFDRLLDVVTNPQVKSRYDWYAMRSIGRSLPGGIAGRNLRLTLPKLSGSDAKKLRDGRRAFVEDILFHYVRNLHPMLEVFCEGDEDVVTKVKNKEAMAIRNMEIGAKVREKGLFEDEDDESEDEDDE